MTRHAGLESSLAPAASGCAPPEDFGQEGTFVKRRFMVLA